MISWKNKFINSILLAIMLGLISCVGTVKDVTTKESNILNSGTNAPPVSFDGLIKANAVSNDKIELQFSPAESSVDIVYEIYINNSPIPIKLNSKSLVPNSSGNFLFTVIGLQTNTTYSFNMRATPAGFASDSKLDPTKSLYATTFNNQTADFLGISNVTLGAGEAGRNSVTVKWTPATITGTAINLKDSDPVRYEITYISQLGGASNLNNVNYNGPDKTIVYTPANLTTPPTLDKEKELTITGLTPGVTYYFQVRAIHKGFMTNESDPFYRRELNTRYLKIKTLNSAGVFDFISTQVYISHPMGETGLTGLDVSWLPALGEFNHYRVCYKKVGPPNGSAPTADFLLDADIEAVINDPAFCVLTAAQNTNIRLAGLESYAYYQAKVIACRTAICLSGDRIKSSLLQARVTTNIAQFSGIQKAYNPKDDASLNRVDLTFNAPITTSGYLTRLKLYCYRNPTDLNPVVIPTNGNLSSATGISLCDGISTPTAFPTNLDDFGTFNTMTLEFTTPIDGTRTYCFSLVPVIESVYGNQEDKASAVVKCFTPEIKTPTIMQFPGKTPVCTTNTGKDLSISWNTPTGGLYSKYIIFYREKNLGTDFFNFSDAVTAYKNNNLNSPYKWLKDIDKALLSYNINNLIPGKNYSIGILPYLINGPQTIFGQYNLNVDDCMLPLPSAVFDEWVDLFAIGPKEDGLTTPTSQNIRRYILETLDDDGIPIEVKVQADDKTPDISDTLTSHRTSADYLDGVYGGKDGKDTNPLNQYSNSGIIKIAWKDVSFFNDSAKMFDYISSQELNPNIKSTRKYGYKVYRSDDNKVSWVDLTQPGTNNKFQTTFNAGLIHPKAFSWKKRNNAAAITSEKIVFFTDYSVKFSGLSGEVDRARTYWYKVIPIFDGKEIGYEQPLNKNHHIIRVTLPPRNMALVHRMTANRTICLEMNKTLNKAENENYSCDYNGLGASGRSTPAAIGETIYDLGGDLLVDRFELSCPFTRGDQNYSNSESAYNGTKTTFAGTSAYGNPFRGCFNESANHLEANNGSFSPTENYKNWQVTPGDCFGNETGLIASDSSTTCSDPSRVITNTFIYPGSGTYDYTSDCTMPSYLGNTLTDLSNPSAQIFSDPSIFPTQSEFAAVYYLRGNWNTPFYGKVADHYPAANGKTIDYSTNVHHPNSCVVNIAYVNSTGQYRPRWIGLSSLFDKLQISGTSTKLSLYNKTISQITSDANLYDSTNVKAPSPELLTNNRYNSQSTLARIMTSNSAKLPGLTGLSQIDFNNLCGTYKVQVGIETSTKSFVALDQIQTKRLMRKKESTVAAAWPTQYSNTQVTALEEGSFIENSTYKGCVSDTRITAPSTPIIGTSNYTRGSSISPTFPNAGKTKPFIMEGSSNLDGANLSSEKCVSRFGVQDLVGNLAEVNADEILCDFTQDQLFLGTPPSIINSAPYNGGFYDPSSLAAWVLPTPKSGSCSLVEKNGDRTGSYNSGGLFTNIYNYLGINSQVIKTAKRFDQDAVLDGRNGDGTFLDFGQNNMVSKLDKNNTLDMADIASGNNYFSPTLGIPLSCKQGCDSNALDNSLFTADRISTAKGYSIANNPLDISVLDFPVNNAKITNSGISEVVQNDSIDTTNPESPAVNYFYELDLGANLNDPIDNFLKMASYAPGSGNPSALVSMGFVVARNTNLKFYTGGGVGRQAGRYSFQLDGSTDEAERNQQENNSGRCVVMINKE